MTRIVIALLALTDVSLAAVDDILANAGTFKPRVTVSDQYDERVVSIVDDGYIYRSLEPNPQNIAVTVVANLNGAVTGPIDARTLVGITAWHFDHTAALGEAPDYKPGLKRATFPLTKDVELPNGDTRPVRVGSVLYVWTTTTLTVTVTCTDIEGAGVGDIAASDYIGFAEPGSAISILNDEIEVSVAFGDASGSRRVFIKGVTRTITRGYGSVANDTYESFDLSSVTLQGSADVTGPVVKATFPVVPTTPTSVNVTGTASDLEFVDVKSVTVNNLPVNPSLVDIVDPDGDGTWAWKVIGLPLKKGTNAIAIVFCDEDGNETKITRSYVVR